MQARGENESGGVGSCDFSATGFQPSAVGGLNTLEQVAAISCKNVPYMIGRNEVLHAAIFFRPRCKLWSCPTCRKTNSDLWCVRAAIGADSLLQQAGHLSLVTITAHENLSRERAIRYFPEDWDKLRKRWRRKSGPAAYLIVPELGNKSGHFHIHLITNNSPTTRWWKDNAREVGLGYMAHESRHFDNPHHAGFYVAKYLKKQFDRDQFAKGFHRVRTSQSWPPLPPLPRHPDWQFSILPKHQSLSDALATLLAQGFYTRMADARSAWSLIETGDLTGTWRPPMLNSSFE